MKRGLDIVVSAAALAALFPLLAIVGPRPQVAREVANYTDVERELLHVRPGITDLASIVFSDEGEILQGHSDPDLAYNQLIRPWKSRLGLLSALTNWNTSEM